MLFTEAFTIPLACEYNNIIAWLLFTEAFTKPLVNLRCENGSAMSDHLVNITWQPTKDQSPDDIVFRLQNCQASISCSNGYRRNVCANHV